jgi:hypothetical protein
MGGPGFEMWAVAPNSDPQGTALPSKKSRWRIYIRTVVVVGAVDTGDIEVTN